jgi:predicted secreted hydrolase
VPPLDLDIGIAPVVEDQEVIGGVPPAAIYWEGKADVTGRQRDLPVAGNAYVELTGYVIPPPLSAGSQRP